MIIWWWFFLVLFFFLYFCVVGIQIIYVMFGGKMFIHVRDLFDFNFESFKNLDDGIKFSYIWFKFIPFKFYHRIKFDIGVPHLFICEIKLNLPTHATLVSDLITTVVVNKFGLFKSELWSIDTPSNIFTCILYKKTKKKI